MCTIVKRVVDLVVRARGDVWEVLLLHSCAIEHLTAGAMGIKRQPLLTTRWQRAAASRFST